MGMASSEENCGAKNVPPPHKFTSIDTQSKYLEQQCTHIGEKWGVSIVAANAGGRGGKWHLFRILLQSTENEEDPEGDSPPTVSRTLSWRPNHHLSVR
ncbi:hypothetical protein DMENIID0001_170450 [Sergentomyia squamirostris]